MLDRAIRWLKRSLILLPGLAVAYFAARELYPVFNARVPADIAILITYIITAYGLIPAALRVFRLLVRPKHLPYYSVTPDGLACDPINIGLIGTSQEVVKAMEAIGWHRAERRTPRTMLKMAVAIVLRRHYPRAPFSNLYLFGRKQDLGFQLPLDNNPLHRHHVRFWAVAQTADKRHEHTSFWQQHVDVMRSDRLLWLGAASLDAGLAFVRHTGQITHMIHHDTNAERELIIRSLKKQGLVTRLKSVQIGAPYRLINRVWRGYMHSDGRITIADLKESGH